MRPRLLLCPPTHYDLTYEINAWMNLENRPALGLAARQWQQLHDRLAALADLELLEPADDCPDLVFTANAGLVLDDGRFLLSRFRHPERQMEAPHFRSWFDERGCEVIEMPDDLIFEGEGDALPVHERWLAGYRFRSDIRSHNLLAEISGQEVLSLELVNDHWYHLDTALFVLDHHTVVYYPGAFDQYARRVIEENFDTLHVVEQEALRFACNSLVVDQTVVMPEDCPLIAMLLKRRGFQVFPIPMSEYIKSGGACKCLALFLKPET